MDEAQVVQTRRTFSLLAPTRRRTQTLTRLLDSLIATAAHPEQIEIVLVVDEDDPQSITFTYPALRLKHVVVPPGQTMGALNSAAYDASTGDYVMLLNDDVIARTPRWDEIIFARLREYPDGIVLVHVNDTLMRDHLCTFPLVSRTFCELAGGICPREYQRYRIDDHVEDVFNLLYALGERRAVYLPDVVFEHNNFVTMPEGHREYHADPAILAQDAPLFLQLFPQRKALALQLLERIDPVGWPDRQVAARQRLDAITDPFSLRIPGRQIGATVPRPPGLWARVWRAVRRRSTLPLYGTSSCPSTGPERQPPAR